jgi:arabinogalactan oligomer/maltooligosaccharide transport system substrate-binding protein
MRRSLTAALAVVALVLTACGGTDDVEPDAPAPEGEETEDDGTEDDGTEDEGTEDEGEGDEGEAEGEAVTRADADLVIWTDETRTPIVQAIGDEFAAEQGITVAVQQLDFGDIRDSLIVAGPAGEGPDIIIGANDWLGQLVSNGAIDPLELGDQADQYNPVAIEAFTYEGQIYGLPYAVENVAWIRNTELAPEPAATMEEAAETGLALVDAGDADLPIALQVGEAGDPYHFNPLFSSFGTTVFAFDPDEGYDPDELLVDSDEGLAFAEALADLGESGFLNADVSFDIARDTFADGRAPYSLSGPWNLPAFRDQGFEFVVEEIPSLGGDTSRPFVGVQGFMVSAYAENPLIATDFVVNYLGTDDVARQIFEADPRPPARLAVAEEVADDPAIAGFLEVSQQGTPLPNIIAMNSVWEQWGIAQRDILVGVDDPSERMSQAGELIRESIS